MLKPAANGISFGLTIQSPKNLGDNMSITAVKNAACQPPIFCHQACEIDGDETKNGA